MRSVAESRLAKVRRKLLAHHGEPPALAPVGPFEMILWEQVAYLADDERRGQAFERLATTP